MSNDDNGDNDLARQKRERGFKQEDERFAKAEAARLEWAWAFPLGISFGCVLGYDNVNEAVAYSACARERQRGPC